MIRPSRVFNKKKMLLRLSNINNLCRLISNSTTNTSQNHFDIIIAGGGLVGTTLACALGSNSKLINEKILLLEAGKKQEFTLENKFSNRVSSLNPGTKKLFTEIRAWDHVKTARYATVKKMQVWDGVSDVMISFENNTTDPNVAYVVENNVIMGAVGKILENLTNVDVMYEAKVSNYNFPEFNSGLVNVDMENGTKYTCRLLLGCDGANSKVRKTMNANYINWNYDQMGVVATLKLQEAGENDTAWQRFLPTGPVALLPLNKEFSSLVWSTTPKHAEELLSMPENTFIDALNHALWSKPESNPVLEGAIKSFDNVLKFLSLPSNAQRQLPPKVIECEDGTRAAFPLGFGHSTSYIGKGVALVGDAAHRVHPLAGQGVNLGFGDVSCLSRVLGNAIYAGSTLDDVTYLKEYETERQRENIPTMIAIEGLHRLYNTSFTPLVLLRSLGLQVTNSIDPLKKLIIDKASK